MANNLLYDSQKFGLYYEIRAETADGRVIIVSNPFTCQFEITRNNLASVNNASFTLFNLQETSRLALFKDAFDSTTFRSIKFYAGYSNSYVDVVPLCFDGSISQCFSERSGQDYRTVIECYDGQQAVVSSFTSQTVEAGKAYKDQVINLVSDLKDIKGAVVGNGIDGQSKRATAHFGNTTDILNNITGNKFYIDSLNGYVLDTTDVLGGDRIIIDSDSGILDIPRKTETSVQMSILFEPRLKPSQQIEIKSSVNPIYNGIYKLSGLSHTGTISDGVASKVVSRLTLLSMTPGFFKTVPDNNESSGFKVVRSGENVPK